MFRLPIALSVALFGLSLGAFAQDAAETRYVLKLKPEASIELEAHWDPSKGSTYGLFKDQAWLNQPKVSVPKKRYSALDLRPLLPPGEVALGETWQIGKDAALPFLSQLHPSVRSDLGRGNAVEGAFGCLRAVGSEAIEILFRTHVLFLPAPEVRFTPAQFEGRFVLGRDGDVLSFSLSLPSRDTNADLNVPFGDGMMIADIGWVPRMEVCSTPELYETEWIASVAEEKARLRLARCFYAAADVAWLPFEEAVQKAQSEMRPLHVVLLFGTLDDESC